MPIRRVTHTFSIFGLDRPRSPVERANAVTRVRHAISTPLVKERLTLGELFGYLNERPYEDVSTNPPATRTLSISIDDDGDVTHVEEILNTPTGEKVADLQSVGAGGWIWAGIRRAGQPDFSTFKGFDYQSDPTGTLY